MEGEGVGGAEWLGGQSSTSFGKNVTLSLLSQSDFFVSDT